MMAAPSLNQGNANSVTITGSASSTIGTLNYTTDDGNTLSALTTEADILEQLKYIRDEWKQNREVLFLFEVGQGDTLLSVTVTVTKPKIGDK